MTKLEVSNPSRREPVASVFSNRLGWAGVALATLATSFVTAFAVGETIGSGIEGLGHVLQLIVLLAVLIAAVSIPRVGAVFVLLGVLLAGFVVARSFTPAGAGTMPGFGVFFGGYLVLTGVLLYLGRPQPRRLVYLVTAGGPILAAVVTIIAMAAAGQL